MSNINGWDYMDNRGYVMAGLAFLLIIPAVILSVMLINMVNMDESTNNMIKSDILGHISSDFEASIPDFTREVLRENTANVVRNGQPIKNSRMVIRNEVQAKIDDLKKEYLKYTDVSIQCQIKSVDSASDPYQIQIESNIIVSKHNNSINRNISQNIPFTVSESKNNGSLDESKISDPLPFIKTKEYGGVSVDGDRIKYGSSLSNYLKSKGINNSHVYENASSPLYFKQCPYDPYSSHGKCNMLFNLKNCVDNGYYHKSADGACILCRLEGKATCNHFGLETFIIPSMNTRSEIIAPCSIDHVIFSENGPDGYGTYPGKIVEFQCSTNSSNRLFLDDGHRNKYGIIM